MVAHLAREIETRAAADVSAPAQDGGEQARPHPRGDHSDADSHYRVDVGCADVTYTADLARGVSTRYVVGARLFHEGLETNIGVWVDHLILIMTSAVDWGESRGGRHVDALRRGAGA